MEKFSESTIRSRARCEGYTVKKSRRRQPTEWDHGGYMLVEIGANIPVVGPYFDADLEDIALFLSEDERSETDA